jgi:hypothetical protein
MTLPGVLLAAIVLNLAQGYPVPDNDTVFGDGLMFESSAGGHFTTHQQRGDDLVLPTGSIVASDAIVLYGAEPFERTVEPGRYQVMLTVTLNDERDKRVAFARVEFRPGTPVRWEAATLPGQDPAAAGYAVDSGIGAFMDAEAASRANQNYDAYGNTLLQHLSDVVNRDEYWTNVLVDPSTGADVVVFTSGFGDGGYASYWGYDANDEVVCLVTDFAVLQDTTRVQ